MKKRLSILLIIALAMTMVMGIGLTAFAGSPDEPPVGPPPQPVVEAEPSSAAHTHDYHWQTIVEPTKDQDGLESEVCVCGATRNIQRIPALGFTLNEYATPMVVNAQPGQTVELELGELNSFPKSFMEKVAVKTQQNVSFGFHYNWKHVGQEIKIPAGTKVDINFDWYGPAKMQELYGSAKIDLDLSAPSEAHIIN